jgi:alpha-N-arabinofuranosidase
MTSMWNPENYPRNGTQFFVGEYAMTSLNDTNALGTPSDGRLVYPTIQGASVEAAFMTGMERNSDVVFASAYVSRHSPLSPVSPLIKIAQAPTLAHVDSTDWTPNLLTFDALDIVRSASYYTQKMFTNNLGTDVLASDPPNTDTTAPLYFVASKGASGKTAILKVAPLSHTHA